MSNQSLFDVAKDVTGGGCGMTRLRLRLRLRWGREVLCTVGVDGVEFLSVFALRERWVEMVLVLSVGLGGDGCTYPAVLLCVCHSHESIAD